MRQYHELCKHILENGRHRVDRTGTGTIGVFGWQMRFNLADGFPLLTTKKLHLRSIIHELLWFLRGDTNIRYLTENNVHIWDEWADENGELGPVYGVQWRHWQDVRVIPSGITKTAPYRPMTYVELIQSICRALPGTKADSFIVFKTDEEGNATNEVIPPEQVAIGSKAYQDISSMADKLAELHDCIIDKYVKISQDTLLDEFHDRGGFEYIGDVWKDGQVNGHIVSREIDQIKNMIDTLKKNPMSRRIIVTAWNPSVVDEQALPPCHALFQFYTEEATVEERLKAWLEEGYDPPGEMDSIELHAFFDEGDIPKYRLSCQLYQR